MFHGKLAERGECLIPFPLRLMREDRGGIHHLAGGIDDRDLDAGAIAGIEAHGHARASRRRQQQIAQIGGKHAHSFGFGRGPQPHAQVDIEMHLDLGPPRPAHGLDQPAVARTALVGDRKTLHDLQLVGAGHAGGRGVCLGLDLQVENLFLLAAEHRQDAVRRQLVQRFAEIEIVLELLALGLLAFAHRGHHAARPTTSARAMRRSGRRLRRTAPPGSRARRRVLRRHQRPACRRRRKAPPPTCGSFCGCVSSNSASGSRPASLAISALVRRFGLYGR